jgi:ribosomal protein RSM22 (predicted rRNA methylase)
MLGHELSRDALATKKIRKALEPFTRSVSELSGGLTKGKETLIKAKYLKSVELRNGYLLYFTTTNFLKVIQPLNEWLPYYKKDTLRMLDLGCGTGAASWGLLEYLDTYSHSITDLEITFADHIKENLDICRRFVSGYDEKPRTNFVHVDLNNAADVTAKFKDMKFDLIIMMNTLNELESNSEALRLLNSIVDDDTAILIIEPASKNESRRLLSIRDEAVKSELTVYSPCTHQMNCPALTKEDDWCFNEVSWERPEFIRYIDDEVGNVRLSLKYSYIILTKNGATLHQNLTLPVASRIVSEVFHEKGRTRAVICDSDGRGEHTLNKRDKSLSNKQFMESERFDLITTAGTQKREHDTLISESSIISVVLPFLGA